MPIRPSGPQPRESAAGSVENQYTIGDVGLSLLAARQSHHSRHKG